MQDPAMKKPLIASLAFHGTVLLLAGVGLPFLVKDSPVVINTPMIMEIVEFDEVTQSNKPKAAQPKPEDIKKPAPPQMTAEAPPDLSLPTPKPQKEEKVEEAEAVPPPEAIKPKKPPKKPPVKPKVTKAKQEPPKKDFASLLRNLTPDDIKAEPPQEEIEPSDDANVVDRLADRLTVSEIDALRAQLAQCWSVMGGARNAEDLIVEVRVVINSDRTVQRATIIDKARYNRDSHFRAAADAAVRALNNPRCSPLKLPENKYESWKSTIIRFDPSQML